MREKFEYLDIHQSLLSYPKTKPDMLDGYTILEVFAVEHFWPQNSFLAHSVAVLPAQYCIWDCVGNTGMFLPEDEKKIIVNRGDALLVVQWWTAALWRGSYSVVLKIFYRKLFLVTKISKQNEIVLLWNLWLEAK